MSNNQSVTIYRQIALFFAGLTFILVLSLLYYSLSYAKIAIAPEVQKVSVEFFETVKEGADSGVPGRIVQTEISGSKHFKTASREDGEPAIASGIITVYNKNSADMILIPTTRFLSKDGVLFRLKKRVFIAANSQVDAEVYADQKGVEGNLEPTRFSVPGLGAGFENVVYGESKQAFTGGVKINYVLTEKDIKDGKDVLFSQLKNKALKLLSAQQRKGEKLLKDGSHVVISKEDVDSRSGDKKASFSVDMTLQIQALFSNKAKIMELAKKELQKQTGEDVELGFIDEKNLDFKVEKYDEVAKTAQLKIVLTTDGILKQTSSVLDKEALSGMTKKEVRQYLKDKPGVKEVKINFSPFWVRKVPSLKDHVQITIEK